MALQANTIRLREAAGERLGADTFGSYLAELEVVEASAERVVLRVGATLAREAARRCGPTLAGLCRELFGARRVLLAGDGGLFDLDQSSSRAAFPDPAKPAKNGRATRGRRRVRQRSGPCGQQGARERLEAQRSFRVPFEIAASLPRTASQAFSRHSAEEPLEYVGRWGRAYSEESLTPFHHRLSLGALRLAQAGCLTDEGVACSINLLVLAAEGKGSRELPVARDQVLPALAGLLHANATHTAHHVAPHTGEPYIAEQRKLEQQILRDVLVRTAEDPERLTPLAEVMVRREDGRFEQTVQLARGGGASILIVFADWVLDALDASGDRAGTTFTVLETAPFLQVGSRRLLSWLAVRTAPTVDAKAQLPSEVTRPPSNTVYKRIDLNHTSVRDFGRHGQDLDRVCQDIREDFCGEHGLADIDRRIHSAHAVWSGGVLRAGTPPESCRTAAASRAAWPPGSGGAAAARQRL